MKRGAPVSCARHGEGVATFVCRHLSSTVGAGFFTAGDFEAHARPDAWCARCEEVVDAEDGWNDVSEAFAAFEWRCSGCYDELRARNEWAEPPAVPDTFTCESCSETHVGLPHDVEASVSVLSEAALKAARCTSETCEYDGGQLIRVCLELPIIGGSGPLVYGVWVSLSDASFKEFVEHQTSPRRFLDGPYFGRFASALPDWPTTVSLKTRVHLRPSGLRPVLELEPTAHPLAVAQREGITRDRHRALVLPLLHQAASSTG